VNTPAPPERPALTGWEKTLRLAALGLAIVSGGFAAAYVRAGVWGSAQFPFAVNSVAKDVLLILLGWLVFRAPRRWGDVAVPLIVIAHVALAIMLLVTLYSSDHGIAQTKAVPGSADMLRWTWFAAAVLVAVLFFGLHFMAIRSRYGLRYLTPSGFRALMALADVLVLRDEKEVTPVDVASRVDRYLARFQAHDKYRIRLAFLALAYLPIFTGHPPFHLMSRDARQDWIQRRFLDQTRDWLLPRWVRDIRTALIRVAQQFSFFGYYGDKRAAARAGYVRFSERPEYEERMKETPPVRIDPVKCMALDEIRGTTLTAEVVVVGTGAGGAMLAYELASRGCDVLMLERGKHVDPSEFTEDEADQLSTLYRDGALQLSLDFRFRIGQGMCVGGSTVVNNAVCFDLPDDVAERWLGPLESGLDQGRLRDAFTYVRGFLGVGAVGPADRRNPGAEHLVAALGSSSAFSVAHANIAGCLGSGYCNIGCKYGRKLSALDWTLPQAQSLDVGSVRVLPECRVQRVLMRGGRAEGVRARLDDGRRITVLANTVVLSAGAIASSIILQRSGLGEGRAGK
jgi:hypothetical protein